MKKRIVSLLLAVTLVFSTPFVTNVKAMDLIKFQSTRLDGEFIQRDVKLTEYPDGIELINYVTSEEEYRNLISQCLSEGKTEFTISSSEELYESIVIMKNNVNDLFGVQLNLSSYKNFDAYEFNSEAFENYTGLRINNVIRYRGIYNSSYKYVQVTFKVYHNNAERYSELNAVKEDFISKYYKEGMSDYDKAVAVQNYVREKVKYSRGGTAHEALVNGNAQCAGFAHAYVYLATAIGLDSCLITGPYHGVTHQWCAVKICNNWYESEPQTSLKGAPLEILRSRDVMSTFGYEYLETTKNMADKLDVGKIDYADYNSHNYSEYTIAWKDDSEVKAVFYRKCKDCGELDNQGFKKIKENIYISDSNKQLVLLASEYYDYLNREYIGTDCNVTKEWEHTCGEGTVTKYSCSVEIDGKEYTDVHFVQNGNCDHKKSESKITKEATCTEKGTVTYTCDCGYEWDEDTDFASCKYETQEPVDVETCSDHYHLERSKCSECGALEYSTMTLYPATHDWHYQSTTKEATCTLKGNDVYECGRCHITQNREVAAKGHGETYVADTVEGDCDHSSYSGNTYCKVCNKIIKSGTYNSDCVGHDYKDETVEWDEYEPLMGNLLELNHYTLKVTTCKKDNCNYRYENAAYTTASGKPYTEKTFKSWKMANGKVVNVKAGYTQDDYVYTTDKDGNMCPLTLDEYYQSVTEQSTGKNNTSKPKKDTKKDTKPKNNKVTTNKVTLKKPGKVTNLNVTSKKKALKLSWKKTSNAKKYEIWICTNKKFKSNVIKKSTTKTSITVRKLKGKKRYYVKVRAVNVSGTKTKNGSWSGVKNKKTKK